MDHGTDENQQTGRLACQACQRKKIKCDRTYPCGQCTRSNLTCTASTRKQRARHAARRGVDSELKNRISKLESLVLSLSGDVYTAQSSGDSETPPTDLSPENTTDGSIAVPSMRRYVASPFWSSLTSEVQALREALEEEDMDGETPESAFSDPTPPPAPEHANVEYDLIVCPPGRIYTMPGAFQEPNESVANQIFDAYLENVEPLNRLFHTPTLISFMRHGSAYLGKPWESFSNQALKRALWFSGINSMTAEECLEITGEQRPDALNHYRRLVGISLAQADLVNTTELATLQAFITYLTAIRNNDTTRRMWTLTSVLVRIATAMNLHREPSNYCNYYTPYQRELRRRMWWRIRFLDVFSSLDRGSELLIAADSYSVPIPTLTNDDAFDESSTAIPEITGCDTDMSFVNVCHEACKIIETLLKPEVRPSGETWEKRHQLALDFSKRVDEKYVQYFSNGTAFDDFRIAVCNSIKASMILRAVRPLQQYVSSTPPRVDSPYVLRIAMECLRNGENVKNKAPARWRWQVWVQWHAMAVALAGLCSIRDTPLAEETWHYVDALYEPSAGDIADSKNGMLWRPVERLYKKAVAFRDASPNKRQHFTPKVQSLTAFDFSLPQPTSDAAIPNTSTTSHQPYPPYQAPVGNAFPNPALDPTAPNNLPLGNMTLDPSLGTSQYYNTNDLGTMDPFAIDPSFATDNSWVDWEQIMNGYNPSSDFQMGGVQPWPYEGNRNGSNGSYS
jgi:hypothetical protein